MSNAAKTSGWETFRRYRGAMLPLLILLLALGAAVTAVTAQPANCHEINKTNTKCAGVTVPVVEPQIGMPPPSAFMYGCPGNAAGALSFVCSSGCSKSSLHDRGR